MSEPKRLSEIMPAAGAELEAGMPTHQFVQGELRRAELGELRMTPEDWDWLTRLVMDIEQTRRWRRDP